MTKLVTSSIRVKAYNFHIIQNKMVLLFPAFNYLFSYHIKIERLRQMTFLHKFTPLMFERMTFV